MSHIASRAASRSAIGPRLSPAETLARRGCAVDPIASARSPVRPPSAQAPNDLASPSWLPSAANPLICVLQRV
jgi:hypothetical protein